MKKNLVFGLAACLLLALSFCKKEFRFTENAADKLAFNTDTLRFDTVFTELGSATRILKIYNRADEWLRVSRVFLEKGEASRFNINADGLPGRSFENLEIAPDDSLYIFVEVTINPDLPLSDSPFILDENLIFETNGNRQTVVLEAWGQNAIYIPSRYSADSLTVLSCSFGSINWDDPRPYVIWGGLFIDECELKIPAGARVHFHGGLAIRDSSLYNDGFLFFLENGRLTVEGTADRPVLFASDRLEKEFAEVPGQWAGIRFTKGSVGNFIDHAIIRNGIVGIRVDSSAELVIKNSRIAHTAATGLLGIHATIQAENLLFYENSGFCTQLEYGGNYQFDHCTMTTYGIGSDAIRLGNTLCLDELCQNFRVNPLFARFRNCIFMGSRADQISLFDRSDDPSTGFDYQFQNCIVRVKDLLDADQFPDFLTAHCADCLVATPTDSLFVNESEYDFHLDSLSIAIDKGVDLMDVIPLDLDGKLRVLPSDIGCFERQ